MKNTIVWLRGEIGNVSQVFVVTWKFVVDSMTGAERVPPDRTRKYRVIMGSNTHNFGPNARLFECTPILPPIVCARREILYGASNYSCCCSVPVKADNSHLGYESYT